MRLSTDQVQAIRNVAQRVLGAGARISVFGSMALDQRKGGDTYPSTPKTLFLLWIWPAKRLPTCNTPNARSLRRPLMPIGCGN